MTYRSKNNPQDNPGFGEAPSLNAADQTCSTRRWRVNVVGVVQGVGFRPFLYRMAHKWGLKGWVRNAADGVTFEVEGPAETLQHFWEDFWAHLPAGSCFDNYQLDEVCIVGGIEPSVFRILASNADGDRQPNIPPDLAMCEECRAELTNPSDRRYRYPFINCTHCGPRWSIVEGVPYDRPLTSMKSFEMCVNCEREYGDPLDRRFHAQPIACPECGPHLELWDRNGEVIAKKDQALGQAVSAVLAGKILALKGLGGFQLICDATNEVSVAQLRDRKRRPHKPFALMMTEEMIVQCCTVPNQNVWDWLRSPARPIVLVPVRNAKDADSKARREISICESVAPDNPYLGVMLPYTPLHYLLLEAINRPIVCTSGNISEEPMAIDNVEAVERLARIADVFLVHNRPIVRPVDDSVMASDRWGNVFMIRRARGFAPRAISLRGNEPPILATGGHLKNVVGLAIGTQAVLSGHIGDLDNTLAYDAHRRAVEDLLKFLDVTPAVVACDLHPDYASSRTAEELARGLKVPLFRWQHHLAHFASCLAEGENDANRQPFPGLPVPQWQRETIVGDFELRVPILGAIWDGTGYGTDGTVWGGEFFVFDGVSFQRVARLRPFPLPGGDAAVRQPRRSLLGLIYESGEHGLDQLLDGFFNAQELTILMRAMERNVRSPRTSSMGRLFDGIAALLGFGGYASFEGQAAMALQYAAERTLFSADMSSDRASATGKDERESREEWLEEAQQATVATGVSPFCVREHDGLFELDWQPLLESIAVAVSNRADQEKLALAFHVRLVEVMFHLYQALKCRSLLISGGCFQNQLLRQLVVREADRRGVWLYQPKLIPAGDGGIALGQLWLTAKSIQGSIRPETFCEQIPPQT